MTKRLKHALYYALLPFTFAVIFILWFGAWMVELVKLTLSPQAGGTIQPPSGQLRGQNRRRERHPRGPERVLPPHEREAHGQSGDGFSGTAGNQAGGLACSNARHRPEPTCLL